MSKDRNEFEVNTKNKTMGEVMDLLAKKWELMSDDEKEEVAAFLSDTRPRKKENRDVSYRQIIDTIAKRWNEFHDWQRSDITELINGLNNKNKNNIDITLEVVKLKHNNAEVHSHTYSAETFNEQDMIRVALLYIYMKGDNPDGTYEINVYINDTLDEQYLVVIDDRKVILCSEISEINLGLFEEGEERDERNDG